MRGRLITFEGIDGCGKSTQARLAADALRRGGLGVVETREPGGTPLGEALRELLLAGEAGSVADAAEVYLFAASRAQLVDRVIRPALARGEWVVCDRYLDSSLAYQGGGRGLGVETVLEANHLAVRDCLPDLTVLLHLPPDAAAARVHRLRDRIEAEGDGLQQRVAGAYRALADAFPERIVPVPGDGSVEAVHARVMAAVRALV